MDARERKAILDELRGQGFSIRDLGEWPPKATFYKRSGEAMPNLPSDPFSLRRYLRRGFLLKPPTDEEREAYLKEHPTPPVTEPSGGNGTNPLKCGICGFEAKSEFGLQSHMRKHEKESVKEKTYVNI